METTENIYDKLLILTQTDDDKADLVLLALLENYSTVDKIEACKALDCPWEEYLRLRKKYSRVLERWKNPLNRKEKTNL